MNSDNIGKVIQLNEELEKIKRIEEKLKYTTFDMSNMEITINVDTETSGVKIYPDELNLIDAKSIIHDFFQNLNKKRKEKVTEIFRELEKL